MCGFPETVLSLNDASCAQPGSPHWVLAELLQTDPEKVQVFSVSDAGRRGEKELNVWFAAHGSPYYKAEKLHGYVAAGRAEVRGGNQLANRMTSEMSLYFYGNLCRCMTYTQR